MFDGWSEEQTHFVALFATYRSKAGKYQETFLTFSPLQKEDGIGAENHVLFIQAA